MSLIQYTASNFLLPFLNMLNTKTFGQKTYKCFPAICIAIAKSLPLSQNEHYPLSLF